MPTPISISPRRTARICAMVFMTAPHPSGLGRRRGLEREVCAPEGEEADPSPRYHADEVGEADHDSNRDREPGGATRGGGDDAAEQSDQHRDHHADEDHAAAGD